MFLLRPSPHQRSFFTAHLSSFESIRNAASVYIQRVRPFDYTRRKQSTRLQLLVQLSSLRSSIARVHGPRMSWRLCLSTTNSIVSTCRPQTEQSRWKEASQHVDRLSNGLQTLHESVRESRLRQSMLAERTSHCSNHHGRHAERHTIDRRRRTTNTARLDVYCNQFFVLSCM